MPGILILVLLAVVAFMIFGFVVHLLFSPWLLLAVAIIALIKFWPRGARSK